MDGCDAVKVAAIGVGEGDLGYGIWVAVRPLGRSIGVTG